MLECGVIEACHSPFASGVVLARKKCGTFCFAVDLRKLNQITLENGDDVGLLPRIDECLRKCAGMTWFTCIDARSAFWSTPIARSIAANPSPATYRWMLNSTLISCRLFAIWATSGAPMLFDTCWTGSLGPT